MKIAKYYVGDFETVVLDGGEQTYTGVWASGLVEIGTEEAVIDGSIDATWGRIKALCEEHGNICVYYHNLKFDGEFWLDYFDSIQLNQAYDEDDKRFLKDKEMEDWTYKYMISDKGQWYRIVIKTPSGFIELRDSYKLLPFSVEKLGKSFGTKHSKGDMIYEGDRYPNCPITEKEREYLKNDLYVVKEALEIMFAEGHTKLTIGSCCLLEFKRTFIDKREYDNFFPNLYEMPLDEGIYGSGSVGEYILKSYGGGWCYVVPGKARRNLMNGITADVNSLYPSVMVSDSGNRYPVGKPIFWVGDIPDKALERYYFVRFRCHFYIKGGKLPFVHTRKNWKYRANENLITSDYYEPKTGRYERRVKTPSGSEDTMVTLTMTGTEYELFREHYDVFDFEILDGCYFMQEIGLFDEYLYRYKRIKENSTGCVRQIAKMFSNNLYGKMAMTTDSSFKVAVWGEDGSLGFEGVEEYNKPPGYIACGSAITAYARSFTIRAATANYYGPDKPGFVYADTDSIHCDGIGEGDLVGIEIDDNAYGKWKIESKWDLGRFVRQKTYLERAHGEVGITCAGMPQRSKDIFVRSLARDISRHEEDSEEKMHYLLKHQEYILRGNRIENFDIGLTVPGKLYPTHVRGGVVLREGDYRIK